MAVDPVDPSSGTELGDPEFRIPSRSLLADDVYLTLRDNLRAGRIAPGARLNLDRLARELHVSNTPIRQALTRLEADGLVTKEPYRGFSASPLLDSKTTSDVYELRLILEPELAARAAVNALEPEADLTEIKELCDPDVIDRLLAAGDSDELGLRDYRLHIGLARMAGNVIATECLMHALSRTPGYTARERNDFTALAWEEHQTIGAAVLAGDSRAAADAMRAHLEGAYQRMRTVV